MVWYCMPAIVRRDPSAREALECAAMPSSEDRLAVQDMHVRYATALDSRDWELLRTVFVPGAQVQYPGSPHLNGFDETRTFCDQALARYRITQHLLGNHRVWGEGDELSASCSLQAIHVEPDEKGGAIFTLWGTYTDRVVRTPDGWRIAERVLTSSHTERRPKQD